MNYTEYAHLDLGQIEKEVLDFWKEEQIFAASLQNRPASNPFTFYEGPPSANGLPGIHHVMARTIKDIFCRYKTLKGFYVERKGGWDTHGLPIELAVEKSMGISKEDIGVKISIEDYNKACREEVLKYTDAWNDLTIKMGYWVDLTHPYVTYHNDYIESLWWILKQFYDRNLLYKGYTVQPYSPAAGTGLSSHELNQPGTYKMVRDTSIAAQFKMVRDVRSERLFHLPAYDPAESIHFLAWTTTPWTLPSNCALAVGRDIVYVKIRTFNPYTFLPISVILARERVAAYFDEKDRGTAGDLIHYIRGNKKIPWLMMDEFLGSALIGMRYEQLMPYVVTKELQENAFKVIEADFVTTEDGTGIVHTASLYGADDFRVCKENGIPPVLAIDDHGNEVPLVDKQGRFVRQVTDFAGRFVKAEYETDAVREDPAYRSTDVLISIQLKEENKAFKVEKYEHSYPHCWRTDKPILYYPLDSWFIRSTAVKDELIALNKTIHWKPATTGTGRFGNWLENLVDWNLSRSRFWGTPLPIWRSKDGSSACCIGSIAELESHVAAALASEKLSPEEYSRLKPIDDRIKNGTFDFHKPFVDDIILVDKEGKKLYRESDLVDVWFDSGAMPYAQWHYPFENKAIFENHYPADFIAEGVDQTRGWFFTLHVISVLLFKKIAFKNVISNGLVLDKNGNKMSKRLGNAIDPFTTIAKYGADPTRWYMIANAPPWENIKFDLAGVDEVNRKFFGTLYNTYAFLALYGNIDRFTYAENEIANFDRPEIDRWILSLLHSLIKDVDTQYNDYEPTKVARAIQYFVNEELSNWYVRLCRRRFWKGDYSADKISAYQTLYSCLETLTVLISPIAPFYSEQLYRDLNGVTRRHPFSSVHLLDFPTYNDTLIDRELEERMELAQRITSLVLSLRKKVNLKVRQPLQKIRIPILTAGMAEKIHKIEHLILSETNIKSVEFIHDTSGVVTKKIKPNFKLLGPKAGKDMKAVAATLADLGQADIQTLEHNRELTVHVNETDYVIEVTDVEIITEDIPGWLVATEGGLTVALDITLNDALIDEGLSREFVNRVQNLRKEKGFKVTDKISIQVGGDGRLSEAIKHNLNYICAETLAVALLTGAQLPEGSDRVEIEGETCKIRLEKVE